MHAFVHRRELPSEGSRFRLALLVALAALVAPAVAQAHPTGPAIAMDYRSTVAARPAAGVRASVLDGDRKLELAVAPSTTVVVLGYLGEPLLRLSRNAVLVNKRSPTAWAEKLAVSPHGRVPISKPVWQTIATGHVFAWREPRLAPRLRAGVHRASWSIRILADGEQARISGLFVRVGRPAIWPWLALGVGLVALGAGVALLKRLELSLAAGIGISVIAGAAGLVSLASFSLTGFSSGIRMWIEISAAGVLAAAAAAGLVLARRGRLAIAGAIGALAAIEGLGRLGIFRHGVVISALPATEARAVDAVAIGAGLASILIVVTYPSRRYAAAGPRRR